MSKLYEALKRLNNENRSPDFQKFTKKPEKKNTKWYILFFVSIALGSLFIYLSNVITKTPKSTHTLKIAAFNSTNTTNMTKLSNSTHAVNATKSINPSNATISPKKEQLANIASKSKMSHDEISNKASNTKQNQNNAPEALSSTNRQDQLKNILHYQQEKGEKLTNLALDINQSLENNDLYRAKLLLTEYLSIQEDPFALNDLAGIYIKENKYRQAVELLNKSIKKEPSAAAYINLIYCYKKLNETDKLNHLLKVLNPAIFSESQKAIIKSIINSK
ncbi:tetratricopeptide repeat protein [Desulfurella sp.]|uniref:tetratricopeptide repeat protein n=1 Tax=Desulfurella sp. TaxID=1962857 RepID=UPI003D13C2A3